MANPPSHTPAQVLGQTCNLYPAGSPACCLGGDGYDSSRTFHNSFVNSLALLLSQRGSLFHYNDLIHVWQPQVSLSGVWMESGDDQCEDWCSHAGRIWHAICLWGLLGFSLSPTASFGTAQTKKDLSWNIFTSVLSAWPFLLLRVLLPQQFLEELQHSYEFNKRWRIHLRIALDQTLWSDMYEFGFQLPALALSLDLKFFTCEGKFSVIKPPFIFLFFLFYCFPLLHFSHELQCVS